MAKRPQRTKEQQEYRDNLAHDIKNLRQYGDAWRDLAKTLLDKKQSTDKYLKALGEWRKLSKKKSKEIADKLIADGEWEYVAMYLDKFEWLDHKEIADKLIENGRWRYVARYLDKFEWLDKEIADKLIVEWYWKDVVKYPEKFWLKKEDN